eukprot:5999687-Pleurochrysis_carterae.AAC.2
MITLAPPRLHGMIRPAHYLAHYGMGKRALLVRVTLAKSHGRGEGEQRIYTYISAYICIYTRDLGSSNI